MMLKLTTIKGGIVLVDTTSCYIYGNEAGTWMTVSCNQDTEYQINETIEEIIQQIKEGGITNVTN
jgi:hypothetical protein